MDDHEAAAADVAGARQRDGEGEGDGDGRVHRVAAAREDLEADRRVASWLTTISCSARTGWTMSRSS